jgi:hypothetical protein
MPDSDVKGEQSPDSAAELELRVRRIHRRDLNRVWEFLKLVFRDVMRDRRVPASSAEEAFLRDLRRGDDELLAPRKIKTRQKIKPADGQ